MIIFTDNRKAHDMDVSKYDEYKKIGWKPENRGVLVMEGCQHQSPEGYPEGTIAAYHATSACTAAQSPGPSASQHQQRPDPTPASASSH